MESFSKSFISVLKVSTCVRKILTIYISWKPFSRISKWSIRNWIGRKQNVRWISARVDRI